MSTPTLREIVESILFVSETPLSLDRLSTILEEFERADIKAVLQELRQEYEEAGRGMVLAEVAEGFQFRTMPATADYIRRLTKTKPARFSQSAMECLAIIAYRQPITRAEVEYLRGVDCGGTLKTLLDRKLIRILGKKDIPGRPLIYGTSKEFLEIFGLKSLAGLPSLKELQDLTATPVFEDQQELPLGERAEEAEGEVSLAVNGTEEE